MTTDSDGIVSATSSDSSIATASVDGATITISGVAPGNAVITVNIAASNSYVEIRDDISVEVINEVRYGYRIKMMRAPLMHAWSIFMIL